MVGYVVCGGWRFSMTVCVLGVCVCVWGAFLCSRVCVAGGWVQVLIAKRWYIPRCSGSKPEGPACSPVHCV